jgi:hypothetical protein
MSQLLAFYRGEGRSLKEFIQWLFPLPEPSRFNPDARRTSPRSARGPGASQPAAVGPGRRGRVLDEAVKG